MATNWKQVAENARNRLRRGKEKAEEMAGQVLQTVEVAGSAFALGYARGRLSEGGEWKMAGVDPELLAGVAFHGLGFLGLFGKYGEHVHNVGDGALAAYAAMKGLDLGVEKSTASQGLLPQGARTAGQMGAGAPRFGSVFDYVQQNAAA